ncbi:autotransporter assembly complex family protein [Pokkaliibacter plantistimulans]|uniref:autotransporter assembly complex protein TamA n=1 Tax=Pokkaliibacter plantistimulans TaxID=1635171 RepID=UPI0026859CBF|nr:autotransporter assembly complex family protein [Pokkaliibacter plantistimulans]
MKDLIRRLSFVTALTLSFSAWAADAPSLKVKIEGVKGELADNVEAYLGIEKLTKGTLPGPARIRYLHRQAELQIAQALAPFGYYRPHIESNLEQQGDNWIAHYVIDPGTAVPYGKINVQISGPGEKDRVLQGVIRDSGLKSGKPLRHADYEALKSKLQSQAADRGYYDAHFTTQTLAIDMADYQANIDLILDTGPRYRIGAVRFADAPVRKSLLERYVTFERGDYVSTRRLLDLQSSLVDSEYFSRVEVQPQWDEAQGDEVPVDVVLEPNKRTRYRFGVGYGTDTGARMRFDQTRRWINDRGHRFNTSILLSQVNNDLVLNYIIPGKHPQTDQYTFRTQYSTENSDTTDSTTLAVGSSWQKKLDNGWQRIMSLDLEQEDYTVDDEEYSSLFLIPSSTWSVTRSRNPLRAAEGYRLSFALRGAAESVLSDTNFVQAEASGKYVTTLTPRTRLLTRADLGATWAGDFDQIPTSHRFYAGGDNSIRGYGYKELGPTNSSGSVIGGKYLVVGSVEADYQFKEDWRVAAFVDTGNAFNDYRESMVTGAGFGLRWQSPVGPVRIDLAKPLNDERSFRIHFTLGPDL